MKKPKDAYDNQLNAAVELERSLLANALIWPNDKTAVETVCKVPLEVWFDTKHAAIANAINTLWLMGAAPTSDRLLTIASKPESTIDVADITALAQYDSRIIDPAHTAEAIVRNYQDRETLTVGRASFSQMKEHLARLDTLTSNLNGKPHPTPHAHWYTSPAPTLNWVFDQTIPLGIVGGINARGGVGKSMLTQTLIISACTGKTLLPSFVPPAPMRVLWLESEDTPDELHRRAERICRAYSIEPDHVESLAKNLTVYAGNAKPFIQPDHKNVYHTTPHYRWLCDEIGRINPSFVCIGSRAHYFSGDENDNAALTMFMGRMSKAIQCSAVQCSMWLIHHVAKATENDPTAASGRGASAARDAMRSLYSMVDLTPAEIDKYGLSNPHLFAKLVNTKANWSPLAGKPIILRRETGENGGVLREIDLELQAAETERDMVSKVASAIVDIVETYDEPLTRRDLTEAGKGYLKDIRSLLRETYGGWINKVNIGKAIDHAIKLDLLSVEKIGKQNVLRKCQFTPQNYDPDL